MHDDILHFWLEVWPFPGSMEVWRVPARVLEYNPGITCCRLGHRNYVITTALRDRNRKTDRTVTAQSHLMPKFFFLGSCHSAAVQKYVVSTCVCDPTGTCGMGETNGRECSPDSHEFTLRTVETRRRSETLILTSDCECITLIMSTLSVAVGHVNPADWLLDRWDLQALRCRTMIWPQTLPVTTLFNTLHG